MNNNGISFAIRISMRLFDDDENRKAIVFYKIFLILFLYLFRVTINNINNRLKISRETISEISDSST